MAIDPLQLPKAAGVDFAEGDVKHLALGDEMSAISIGNATRNLAERDNIVAGKVQEIIDVVNNKEQFVNLPTVRTILPPLSEEVITNYRIPPGFEARVLNAVVNSTPSATVKLEIFYSPGFGASTGDSLVSTLIEFTGETKFHGEGEFIIKLTNIGSVSAETVASIILTMRPIFEAFGSLIGAGTKGDEGEQGPKGDDGGVGGIGNTGPAGRPGMNWTGPWNALTSYLADDGVSYTSGAIVSSFIATSPHTGTAPNVPGAPWDVFASGAQGATGTAGPATPVTFLTRNVSGTLITSGSFVAGASDSFYQTVSAGTTSIAFVEAVVKSGSAITHGLSFLQLNRGLNFAGTVLMLLPQKTDGAEVDYSQSQTVLTASAAGSNTPVNVIVSRLSPKAFYVTVPSTTPQKISFALTSVMPVV